MKTLLAPTEQFIKTEIGQLNADATAGSSVSLTLINNNGVFKPQQGLAQVDRSAYVTATISLRGQKIQKAVDWITDKELEVKTADGLDGVSVSIAPGAISIIELSTRK